MALCRADGAGVFHDAFSDSVDRHREEARECHSHFFLVLQYPWFRLSSVLCHIETGSCVYSGTVIWINSLHSKSIFHISERYEWMKTKGNPKIYS